MTIDEVVEPKSGKQTRGLSRFFSSIASKVIPSVCFHILSLIEMKVQKSFVLSQEQHTKGKHETKPKRNKQYSKSKTCSKQSPIKASKSPKR